MSFKDIPLGSPENLNVLVENIKGNPNKYELDESGNYLKLDFVFYNGLVWPLCYGSVAQTLAEDGDPVDAFILSSFNLFPNSIIAANPVGILKLKDRGEQDNKLLTVPAVDPLAHKIKNITDISEDVKRSIIDFLNKVGVQKQKTIEIEGFFGKDEAVEEVKRCIIK